MVSEKKMRDILRSVRAIGRNNAGVQEAAHLLAEAMKEGVVWEGEAELRHLHCPPDAEHTYLHYPHIDDYAYTECFSEGYVGKHGERVRVIVRSKEEEDGEGV